LSPSGPATPCARSPVSTKVAKRDSQAQTLTHVGDNLYRSDASEIHYAIFKRNGKQIRRSLHTTDKEQMTTDEV